MAQATLTVTMPEQLWLQQVSTDYPEVKFQLLSAIPGSESGFALTRLVGPTVSGAIDDLDNHPQISNLSLVEQSDERATVHFETTAPLLFFSSQASEIAIDLPIEIQNGEATVEVSGSREQLADLARWLEQIGLRYQIKHVTERLHESQLLSERQLEVIVVAVEEGYYDTPRRCSLTEIAEHLDIAKSTCSETLHRAEEAIIKRFVEDLPGVGEEEPLEEQLAAD